MQKVKHIKLSGVIILTIILATIARPCMAQKLESPSLAFEPPPILSVVFQIMAKAQIPLEVIAKFCEIRSTRDVLMNKKKVLWPLATNPRIINFIATCKRSIKQNGANTQATEAIFIILNKLLSFTKEEWLLIRTLAPDEQTLRKMLQNNR